MKRGWAAEQLLVLCISKTQLWRLGCACTLVCIRIRALFSALLLCVCATCTNSMIPRNGMSDPVTVLRVLCISIHRHAESVKWTLQKQEIRKGVIYSFRGGVSISMPYLFTGNVVEMARIELSFLIITDVLHHEDPAAFPLLSYITVFSLLWAVPWFWMGRSTLQEAS